MKKTLSAALLAAGLVAFSATAQADPVFGVVYKNATQTGDVLSGVGIAKSGKATCTSYFGLVGLGKCGIGDAAKAGKIKNVAFYDTHTRNILGYQKITTTVYGQ